MHKIKSVAGMVSICLFCGLALAGTIYTWTDEEGVKRFSNAQPPEGARNVETIEEVAGEPQNEERRRQEFDRLAEEAGREADQHFEEQAQKRAREEQAERERQLAEQNQRIEEELAKLNKEIEEIRRRGLGPTFTVGMRDNQIRLVQQKIDLLKSDPNVYFNR